MSLLYSCSLTVLALPCWVNAHIQWEAGLPCHSWSPQIAPLGPLPGKVAAEERGSNENGSVRIFYWVASQNFGWSKGIMWIKGVNLFLWTAEMESNCGQICYVVVICYILLLFHCICQTAVVTLYYCILYYWVYKVIYISSTCFNRSPRVSWTFTDKVSFFPRLTLRPFVPSVLFLTHSKILGQVNIFCGKTQYDQLTTFQHFISCSNEKLNSWEERWCSV